MTQKIRRVAVIGGNRIPFARSNGPYAHARQPGHAHRGPRRPGQSIRPGRRAARRGRRRRRAQAQPRLQPDPGGGAGQQARPAHPRVRRAAGLRHRTEAAILVANKIALGQIDAGVAGGVDTTSDAPLGVNEDLRRILLDANRARSLADKLKLVTRLRPGHVVPDMPRNAEPRTGLSMGEHAAVTAEEWDITREDAGRADRRAATGGWPRRTRRASSTTSSRRTWA